jgi:hypothetical protein
MRGIDNSALEIRGGINTQGEELIKLVGHAVEIVGRGQLLHVLNIRHWEHV